MDPTSVYRYFDSAGQLLYVGITGRGVTRQFEHARSKEWWPLVATSDVTHFATRKAALAEEAYQIRWNQPPFNTQGKGRRPDRTLIPRELVRTMLGRLSRQKSLDEVDLGFLVGEYQWLRPSVQHQLSLAMKAGESISDLRIRLKNLAEPNGSDHR